MAPFLVAVDDSKEPRETPDQASRPPASLVLLGLAGAFGARRNAFRVSAASRSPARPDTRMRVGRATSQNDCDHQTETLMRAWRHNQERTTAQFRRSK